MIDSAWTFLVSLLPWHRTFDAGALFFTLGYIGAQLLFCVSLRRLAMIIPGPERMCSPLGLWVLAIPGFGALASFAVLRQVWDAASAATAAHRVAPPRGVARGFAITYGVSRLLILLPGMLIPALLLQSVSATGFLLRLTSVARSLRTRDVAVA
ncbi:MAG: hypothetical protein H7099_05175 [Gemmatimonadaceae bacterium]|nr:hypothetical protein [Gemmatimonadaceae bacterium]